MPRTHHASALKAIAAGTALITAGLLPQLAGALPSPASPAHAQDPERIEAAEALLTTLADMPPGSPAPYDRSEFGERWRDVDRNGCDQRNDVLRRDLSPVELDPDSHGCRVIAGTLADPYTGATIIAEDRQDIGDLIHIDHIVPLAVAWEAGASGWAAERREAFANDPAVLLAVDARANLSKGDAAPSEWMPETGRCEYAAAYVEILHTYGLGIDASSRDKLASTLAACTEDPQ